MIEDIIFSLKYRYECDQGENEYQDHHSDSEHATD